MIIYINSKKKYLGDILAQINGLEGVSVSYQPNDDSVEIHDLDDEYIISYGANSIVFKKPVVIDDLVTNLMSVIKDCFYEIDGRLFYPWRRSVVQDAEVVHLTEKENHLLYFLLSNKNSCISKKDILKSIWGYSEELETSTLEAHIFRLRSKLSALGINDLIVTLESGYMVKI